MSTTAPAPSPATACRPLRGRWLGAPGRRWRRGRHGLQVALPDPLSIHEALACPLLGVGECQELGVAFRILGLHWHNALGKPLHIDVRFVLRLVDFLCDLAVQVEEELIVGTAVLVIIIAAGVPLIIVRLLADVEVVVVVLSVVVGAHHGRGGIPCWFLSNARRSSKYLTSSFTLAGRSRSILSGRGNAGPSAALLLVGVFGA